MLSIHKHGRGGSLGISNINAQALLPLLQVGQTV